VPAFLRTSSLGQIFQMPSLRKW